MSKRVLGVLAGKDMPADLLRRWAADADVVLAADGGADRLLEAGVRPSWIVGDMDSISKEARDMGCPILHVADQDTTDCDKLLQLAASMSYKAVTLASVEGDALDHLLATVYSALRADVAVRFALRTGVAWVLQGGRSNMLWETVISAEPGRRVSLVPLLPCAGVDFEGVEWPLSGAELSPTGLVSVSNRAAGTRVRASVRDGAALLVAEYSFEEMPFW